MIIMVVKKKGVKLNYLLFIHFFFLPA